MDACTLLATLDTTNLQNQLNHQLQSLVGSGGSSSFTTPIIFIWVITGAIGTGYFIYGRKQHRYVQLFAGIGLGLNPMFISGFWPLLLIGVALIAAPFLIRE